MGGAAARVSRATVTDLRAQLQTTLGYGFTLERELGGGMSCVNALRGYPPCQAYIKPHG